jgi:hypothetical protein
MSSSSHAINLPSLHLHIQHENQASRVAGAENSGCSLSHLPRSRKRGKLSAGKADLDHHIEFTRAGRSSVKPSRTDPQRLKLYCGGWVGRILGSVFSHEPSCPSRLHLLHNGASTQTTMPSASEDFGQTTSIPSCCFIRRR